MLHQHPSEDNPVIHQSRFDTGDPEVKPLLFFGAMSIAILFGLWFFLFASVRPAADVRPEHPAMKIRTTSARTETPRKFAAPEKERPARNGEEKALLLYMLNVFDGRSVAR